jgi:hypothetical protein
MLKHLFSGFFLLAALAGPACAQEVSVLAGQMKVNVKDDQSFAAALNYLHPVGDYLAFSASYLNEGHPQGHHRDGLAAEGWLRLPLAASGVTLSLGGGKYYYFDTARDDGIHYDNDHGWANMASASLQWQIDPHWYVQGQVSRLYPDGRDGTTLLMAGAGYRFDGSGRTPVQLGAARNDTLTASYVRTIVNSFDSERANGYALEYRRALGRYVDASVTALSEGSNRRLDRRGVAAQLWLMRDLTPAVELGMGAGPYAFRDLPDRRDGQYSHWAGIASIVGRYHLDRSRWTAQLSWNRVISNYERDADVFMLGVGAGF